MPAFAAGATIEQRYLGASREDARRTAGPQLAAFEAAGWAIASEAWASATVAAMAPGVTSPLPGARGGTLVVTFRAERDADLPARLDGNSIHALPGFDFHGGRIPEGGAERLTVTL